MENPKEVYQRLVELGSDWAQKEYAAQLLEETKKCTLSKFMNDSEEKSIAAKETISLANPLYREHLAKMCEAKRDANLAKVKYDAARAWVDMLRSQMATERVANKFAT